MVEHIVRGRLFGGETPGELEMEIAPGHWVEGKGFKYHNDGDHLAFVMGYNIDKEDERDVKCFVFQRGSVGIARIKEAIQEFEDQTWDGVGVKALPAFPVEGISSLDGS